MISILCPTRGRPAELKRMIDSAFATAHNPADIRVMYFVGSDDPKIHEYPKELRNCMMLVGPPWSAVMASNYLSMKCKEYFPDTKLFMVGSDDMILSDRGWDGALKEHYGKLNNKIHVYSLRDSRDANGTPHPIMTKEYIDAMGYFLPPIFLHWFVDTWTVQIARSNKLFTHLMDYLLIHDKPSDRGAPDETHTRIRNLGWHDRDRYVNETCQHFLGMEEERLGLLIQLQNGTREHLD